jgi:chromosome segregation ATPase
MENESTVLEMTEIRTPDIIATEIRTAIHIARKQVVVAATEIGLKLIEAKELVPRGEWTEWLRDEVQFSERSAQNYMKIAASDPEIISTATSADLNLISTLRLLALPDDDQQEIAEKVKSGELDAEDVTAEIEELRARAKALEEENAGLQLRLEDMEDYTPTDDEIAELKARAEKAERDAADNNRQMEELRVKADDAAQKLRDAKAKADAAAQKKIDKAVEDAKAELEANAASASAGEIERLKSNLEAAEARAAAADKSAAIASNPDMVKLKMIYSIIQTNVDEAIEVIMLSNGEDAVKYRDGLKRFLETMIGRTEV